MKLFIFFFLLSVGLNSFAQVSYVPFAKTLSKKGYQLSFSGDVFTSSERRDKDGENIKFNNGESFSRTQFEFNGQYGLMNNFLIGGGLRLRQNNSVGLDSVSSEKESETSSGVESTFVNFLYAFKPTRRLQYAFEGLFRYRPFTNKESSDGTPSGSLILGDSGNEYAAGLSVTYSSPKDNFLSGKVLYRRPGADLSTELFWQVEGALVWKKVAFLGGAEGISSLNNDPYESDPTDRPVLNTGSTFLYNSSNRELLAPYVGINLSFWKEWRVELKGSQVINGQSTDLGSNFSFTFVRRVEENKTVRIDRSFKNYDFEGTIIKVSPKKQYVTIDRGLTSDVEKGLKIDFYEFDYVGGNILLARGVVIMTKSESSVVKITHHYNIKKPLKEGVVARGTFR